MKARLSLSFIVPILILFASSIIVLQSIAPQSALPQLIFFSIGLLAFMLISRIDYHIFTFSPWPYYAASVLLLLLTLLLGTTTRGSTRWIEVFGVNLQTSEFIKPLLIMFFSFYLSENVPKTAKDLLKFALITSVPIMLIYLQPDFGTSALIAVLALFSLIASGVRFKLLIAAALIGSLLIPATYFNLKPYQKERLVGFAQAQSDPLGAGYNALQAKIAVGAGKLFGRGLGHGTQSHLKFLPEKHTDFIFAALVEELGFIGGLLIIGSYTWLLYGLTKTARSAMSDAGSLICLLGGSLIAMQAFINIGMNMGLLPVTGVTLPLVSAGGSSVLSFLALLGISFAVAKRARTPKAALEIR